MRYKNPTPNPLPASDEGAKMYLIRAETAVVSRSFRHPQKADLETVIMQGSLKEHDPSGEKIMTLTNIIEELRA